MLNHHKKHCESHPVNIYYSHIIHARSYVPGSPRLEPTLTMPALYFSWQKPEKGQIPERLRLLLKSLTLKGIHVPLRAGFASYHMYLTLHGWEKIMRLRGRRQIFSKGGQKTQGKYIPSVGPMGSPCKPVPELPGTHRFLEPPSWCK